MKSAAFSIFLFNLHVYKFRKQGLPEPETTVSCHDLSIFHHLDQGSTTFWHFRTAHIFQLYKVGAWV